MQRCSGRGPDQAMKGDPKHPRVALGSPRVVALLLFAGAAVARLALATQVVFPPLGDAAYYIAVAQSLYAGRGFTVGSVWNYQPPPPTVVGPSNSYWGPLPSIFDWLGLLAFGNHLYAALLPGALLGAGLVALSYLIGRGVLREWLVGRGEDLATADRHANWLALGAALLLAVNADLTYQSAIGDSSMLYGAIGFAVIGLWERALRTRRGGEADAGGNAPDAREGRTDKIGRALARVRSAVALDRAAGWPGATVAASGTGVLLGGAYLTRGSFLFLALACAGWWAWRFWRPPRADSRSLAPAIERGQLAGVHPAGDPQTDSLPNGAALREKPGAAPGTPGGERWRLAGAGVALVLGAAIVTLPWLIRQQVVFGHMFTPEATHNALAFDMEEFTDYGATLSLASLLRHGLAANLALRAQALWLELRTVNDFLLYPTALPAYAGLALLARRLPLARFAIINILALVLGFAVIFPAVTLHGGYYHSVASVAPFLAWGYLACVYAAASWLGRRLPLRLSLAPALAAIPVLIQVGVLTLAAPQIGAGAARDGAMYASIGRWLHAHHVQVVMTTEAATVNYATGIPAIELPAAESPDVAYACAQRYGAQYLVISEASGAYPRVLHDHPDPRFVLIVHTPEYEVYQIEP